MLKALFLGEILWAIVWTFMTGVMLLIYTTGSSGFFLRNMLLNAFAYHLLGVGTIIWVLAGHGGHHSPATALCMAFASWLLLVALSWESCAHLPALVMGVDIGMVRTVQAYTIISAFLSTVAVVMLIIRLATGAAEEDKDEDASDDAGASTHGQTPGGARISAGLPLFNSSTRKVIHTAKSQ